MRTYVREVDLGHGGAFCGNGLVDGSEVCDDGNEVNNDGCNSHCTTGPNACETGVDRGTGFEYVVCSNDGASAWVSIADGMGGTYHAELICQELGFTTVGEFGGNCGSICGFCEMVPSSCEMNGNPNFDGGGECGMDEHGPLLCTTVHWTCV